MQRLGGPSLFPKLPVSTQLWKCQTRYIQRKKMWRPRPGEPLRKTYPTFEFSELLLDLDAEGIKGVRPFNPLIDGEPEPRSAQRARELQPIKERVANFERHYDECESNFKSISADKFHPLHISDFDLLSVALLDSLKAQKTAAGASIHDKPTSYADMLNSVLDKNGVPLIIRHDTSNTVTYMRYRRQSLARGPSPAPEDEELLATAFSRHTTFSNINRLVTRAIQTPEGCRILSDISDELHRSLITREVEPIQLLSLLNNILINFDRYGLHMSNKLYELGIQASLKCHAIVATQKYIQRRVKRGDYDDNLINSILTTLLQTSIASASLHHHKFQLDVSSRLRGVFSLLTGYVPGEDQTAFSLRSLVSPERPNGFHLYIQCLARLGAFRTIWHEWQKIDSPSHARNIDVRQDSAFKENGHFVTAILDSLAKNHDIAGLARSSEFTNVTGQFWEDCQLDMLGISRSAKTLALPDRAIGNSDRSPTYWRNWDKLYQIFRETQMQNAFLALQVFLMSKPTFP
ncbi:hypothetical protein GQX73_g6683 [Xylaria multiplex]|uniref:Uncharacterized protein n=1 Tax=Xylaria multiplex TaxID=323545 RepID=A0A7C8ISA9_9PEZI|nr:hypothetical protein GQX73_g6683 [Xylaria multiplex]